jgi:hypothetical protein
VDHEGRGIEEAAGPAVDDISGVVDLDQIRGLDLREGDAEGVYPEGARVDWIPKGDVPCYAFSLVS